MALPKWYDHRRENNRRSREQERDRARSTGGRTRSGSGSSWRQTQDVLTADGLEQLKFTQAKSFSLTASELRTIQEDAVRAGREPLLIIDFTRDKVRAVITIEFL